MELESQWWWLGVKLAPCLADRRPPTLCTADRRPWQSDQIVHEVQRQYDERYRMPIALVRHPWSKEAAIMMLLTECRDVLVGPGHRPMRPVGCRCAARCHERVIP